ncbi:MAG: FAD-dependent oxidoreductase, partial [Akkermansiaceae bacterium]
EKKVFPDASVPTTWSIDLHYPKKEFHKGVAKDNPFISIAVHDRKVDRKSGYNIPYRCFYSKNIENLFMAGRCVSVDRRALGTTRVMRTCGMMGEVVGKAAWIATSRNTSPRGVYQNYLPVLIDLMEQPGRARRTDLNAPLTIPPIPKEGLRVKPEKQNIINLKGLVVDDVKAKLQGSWSKGDGLKPNHGLGYQYAPHPASATYNIRVKDSGKYEVRVHWLNHKNRTTSAELSLTHAKGTEIITLDQTKTPAEKTYTSLGTFEFLDVIPAKFTITSKATGNLHIDAVQLLKSK